MHLCHVISYFIFVQNHIWYSIFNREFAAGIWAYKNSFHDVNIKEEKMKACRADSSTTSPSVGGSNGMLGALDKIADVLDSRLGESRTSDMAASSAG